jgi:hypothetical protein
MRRKWFEMDKAQLTDYLMSDRNNLSEIIMTLYKRGELPEKEGKRSYTAWTEKEQNMVKRLYFRDGISVKGIIEQLTKEVGTTRSEGAIRTRIKDYIDPETKSKKAKWTNG